MGQPLPCPCPDPPSPDRGGGGQSDGGEYFGILPRPAATSLENVLTLVRIQRGYGVGKVADAGAEVCSGSGCGDGVGGVLREGHKYL